MVTDNSGKHCHKRSKRMGLMQKAFIHRCTNIIACTKSGRFASGEVPVDVFHSVRARIAPKTE